MKARYPLAAAMITLMAAVPASATVLSATNQAVGTKSSKADYLRVTVVQDELNMTMKEMNEASTQAGGVASPAPSVAEGGYNILEKEGDGGGNRPGGDIGGFVFGGTDGREGGRLSIPNGGGRGTRDVTGTDLGNRGGRGRRGGNHATPEPSTWMLLGAGLALFGGYATLRRRSLLDS
jgi:PEP-CTERM motif